MSHILRTHPRPPVRPVQKQDERKARNAMSDEELDHAPLPVGQYKGQTPSQIAEHDPGYLLYLAQKADWKVASEVLLRDCEGEVE